MLSDNLQCVSVFNLLCKYFYSNETEIPSVYKYTMTVSMYYSKLICSDVHLSFTCNIFLSSLTFLWSTLNTCQLFRVSGHLIYWLSEQIFGLHITITSVTRLPNSQQTFGQTEAQMAMMFSPHWEQRRISSELCTLGTWWCHAPSSTQFQPVSHITIHHHHHHHSSSSHGKKQAKPLHLCHVDPEMADIITINLNTTTYHIFV